MIYRALNKETNAVASEMDSDSPHFEAWQEIIRSDKRLVILGPGQRYDEFCRKLEGSYGRQVSGFVVSPKS